MEPCPLRHGNTFMRDPIRSPSAASMEPCPLRHGNSIIVSMTICMIDWLQWSHVLSDMVTGFGCRYHTQQTRASMEPCPLRHGNVVFPFPDHRYNPDASMEPCPLRHGNLKAYLSFVHDKQLQWSHVLSDMVTRREEKKT